MFWSHNNQAESDRNADRLPNGHTRQEYYDAGFSDLQPWEGAAVFRYDSPQDVLEHLLNSGAGTAFYDAIAPHRRDALTRDFLEALAARHPPGVDYEVPHEFIACVARRP